MPHRQPEPEVTARAVPEATVARLAVYLRVLTVLRDQGVCTVSSEYLAASSGVGSAKLRKDLSFLGSIGTRGVGYDVPRLMVRLEQTLGLDRRHRVALVGAGNLGRALAGYQGFRDRGFPLAAVFDDDPARCGEVLDGVVVRPVAELEAVCAELEITIGVLATPAASAQAGCDRLVAAGVRCVLNFAPAVLVVPADVDVRKVDLSVEMQVLSFHLARRAGGSAGLVADGDAAGVAGVDGVGRDLGSLGADVLGADVLGDAVVTR